MTSPPRTVEDENATTLSDVDVHTRPTTTTTERRPTTPEGSILIVSATTATMNEPTTTSELLGKDIQHTTSSDQIMTIGEVPDKESQNDVMVDSKLAITGIYLSGSSLVVSFVLAIAMFVLVVSRKRKAKESESANIRMSELTIETIKSTNASNIYCNISPTHSHEEKLDLM